MTKQLKSQDFPEVYKELGIDLNKLGCVMLDTESLTPPWSTFGNIDLYTSPNPDRFWIKGWVASKTPHITLLYGLLKSAKEYKNQIEEVLKGWKYKEAEIENVSFFDSPYPDEPYWCIIAHIKVSDELLEGHQRLEFLPHINTFAGYQPHISIVYINKSGGVKQRDMIIDLLNAKWSGKKIKVSEKLNLGGGKD